MAVVGSRKHSVSLTPCRLMSDHPPGTVEERVRASADRHDGREHRITQFHHGARANRLRSTSARRSSSFAVGQSSGSHCVVRRRRISQRQAGPRQEKGQRHAGDTTVACRRSPSGRRPDVG
jgi:hypothetical protein